MLISWDMSDRSICQVLLCRSLWRGWAAGRVADPAVRSVGLSRHTRKAESSVLEVAPTGAIKALRSSPSSSSRGRGPYPKQRIPRPVHRLHSGFASSHFFFVWRRHVQHPDLVRTMLTSGVYLMML